MSVVVFANVRWRLAVSVRLSSFNRHLAIFKCQRIAVLSDFIRKHSSKAHSRFITVPNALTCLRIATTPLIVSLILKHDNISAAGLTLVVGLTDIVCQLLIRQIVRV